MRRLTLLLAALLLAAPAAAQEARPRPKPAPLRPDALDQRVERFQLSEVRVDEGLRLFSEVSGVNVLTTPAAGKQRIQTLLLRGLSARDVLEGLCKAHGLWFKAESGVVRVMTAEEYQKDLRVVREQVTRVFSLLHPNPVAVAGAIRDLYGNRVQLSFGLSESDLGGNGLGGNGLLGQGGLQSGLAGTSLQGSGTGRFSDRFQGQNQLALQNQGAFSGAGGAGGVRTQDASEKLKKETLSPSQLAALRVQQGKVKGDLHGLTQGLPPIRVTVNRRHNLVVVRTSDKDALQAIARLIEELDRPTPQVLLEVKILEARLSDSQETALEVDFTTGPSRQNLATGKPVNPLLQSAGSALEQVARSGNFPVAGGTLVYQFLNEHVRARLQALAGENRLAVLATPLLLAANNEVARIFVGEERPLVRNFQLQTTTTNGVVNNQVVPTVDLRDIGNTLRILPRINADRTVSLTLVQDVSSVNPGGAALPVPTQTGGIGTFAVDTVNTANLEGTVVAKDGLTLAVGGLIRKEHVDTRQGVPYLMDLPWIGWLFGSSVRRTERRELILLITPHVLLTPQEGQRRSKARLEALSLHPYHDHGDKALNHYTLEDVPGAKGYHKLVEDYFQGAPEPLR